MQDTKMMLALLMMIMRIGLQCLVTVRGRIGSAECGHSLQQKENHNKNSIYTVELQRELGRLLLVRVAKLLLKICNTAWLNGYKFAQQRDALGGTLLGIKLTKAVSAQCQQ